MMHGVFVGLGQVPGAENAINWVKARVGEFYQLPERISKLQDKAAKLQTVADQKKRVDQAARTFGVSTALKSSKENWATTEAKLSVLLANLKSAGLGVVVPLGIALSGIAMGGSMVYLFKTVDYQEKVLADIAKKILTPEEAARLFPAGGSLFGFGLPVGLVMGAGALIFVGFLFLKRNR
jgi:hypothetical protein